MQFSSPLRHNARRMLLLGAGELGKEVAIEAQRLGLEVIAVDRYEGAPAMQVAHRAHVIDMRDADTVLEVIRREQPDWILPEIEAISIEALFAAEAKGFTVIPNAEAVNKTMNRKHIRQFAAETLGLKTGAYRFVRSEAELAQAAAELGWPCVVKPVMSSSGHGQSVIHSADEVGKAWQFAQADARGDASELIVEAFIDFDYEITLLTARNGRETVFCAPIGHIQQDGDYIFSWQPHPMEDSVLAQAQQIARTITDGLGGRGIFGVELFVKGDEVYFSEVSPRPHDTGMVTLITQNKSEFALHVQAVLGLPLDFTFMTPGASAAYKASGHSSAPVLDIPENLFSADGLVRVFGKPVSHCGRRMAVVLAQAETAEAALEKARARVAPISDH
ncbi:formate-dependent phosphoribosylglycinamide formyltransferase [Sulfurivirga caldicuralii]|uniref:Formate-dependent phosphoribosylglycinamide formyltransferase n=1 Tax=Sulfurivirga caldicuralii TaxID=364032 RepID=A0A1N6HAV8_9GAMM|nr:formate-dependent phosphoribosylglycinamide formyltransferase [Sulfurivirga caldicuralii]SIO16827.1 formate-dependent phosphoribosylglycinamide formyltransferase [Sulfurivirga caldicuralii]